MNYIIAVSDYYSLFPECFNGYLENPNGTFHDTLIFISDSLLSPPLFFSVSLNRVRDPLPPYHTFSVHMSAFFE